MRIPETGWSAPGQIGHDLAQPDEHRPAVPSDADGFTADDHLTELERSVGNLKRAVNAGVPGSVIFEAGQVTARCRAITGLAKVQELLS